MEAKKTPSGASLDEVGPAVPSEPLAALAFHQDCLAGEVAALRSEQGNTLHDMASCMGRLEQNVGQVLEALQLQNLSETVLMTEFPSKREPAENPAGAPVESAGFDLPHDWPTRVAPRFAPEQTATMLTTSSRDREFVIRTSVECSRSPPRGALGFVEKYLILDPNSFGHMAYSMLTWPFLLWDLTVIPYTLTWGVPLQGHLLVQAWMATCFWTFDIAMSFLTGISSGGVIITNPCRIARRFVHTWLVPDLLAVASDWLSMVLVLLGDVQESRALKTVRLVKLGRLFRIFNMLRVIKLVRILEGFVDRHFHESQRLALRFFTLFSVICWVAHLMSCGWYAVGILAHSDTGMRWTESSEFGTPDQHLYTYTSCFHWAISRICLGSGDIGSYNSAERLFSVCCLMCGLLFGSVLISVLSGMMLEFHAARKERNQNLRQLRKFLADNSIRQKVALRVQQQVTTRLDEKAWLSAEDVVTLKLLSDSMRRELLFHYYQPHFIQHPLFRLVHHLEPQIVSHICLNCLEMTCLRPTDELFAPGPAKAATYLLTVGRMMYSQEPESSRVEYPRAEAVEPKQWIAEAALWSVWTHVGRLQANTWCNVLVVGAQVIEAIIGNRTTCGDITLGYCATFHNRLTAARPPDQPWPSDLQVPFTEYTELVMSMDRDLQLAISRAALQRKDGRGSLAGLFGAAAVPGKARKSIERELLQGKCTLVVNQEGAVERVAVVLALHIEQGGQNVDGERSALTRGVSSTSTSTSDSVLSTLTRDSGNDDITRAFRRRAPEGQHRPIRDVALRFVQLGKQEEDTVSPACQLPGAKVGWGESSAAAYSRILHGHLAPMASNVEYMRRERRIEWKKSSAHGVRTKYLITVCRARTRMPINAPMHYFTAEKLRDMLLDCDDVSPSFSMSPSCGFGRRSRNKLSCGLSIVHGGMTVYKIDNTDGRAAYYAWLNPEAFDFLSSPVGERTLTKISAELSVVSFSDALDMAARVSPSTPQTEWV